MLSHERSAVTVDRDAAQKPGRRSHSCGGRQTWAESGAKLRYILGTSWVNLYAVSHKIRSNALRYFNTEY